MNRLRIFILVSLLLSVVAPLSSQVSQQVNRTSDGKYTVQTQVQEVVMSCTVLDKKGHLVTDLSRENFSVTEDRTKRPIVGLKHEDVPVSMAIIVDDSGSMRKKRPSVIEAALDLIRASNAEDEALIVHFSSQTFVDQDLTSDLSKLRIGLQQTANISGGGTALYDAVINSAGKLVRTARHHKQVLILVTDGDDNASVHELAEAVRSVQELDGPIVYAIGLLSETSGPEMHRSERALDKLADETGGIAFFPASVDEIGAIAAEVARDIRSQYTLAYRPPEPANSRQYRPVHVEAKTANGGKLVVRTRKGYTAGPSPLGNITLVKSPESPRQ
jgi:Ca-activated chloride channel homolog